LRAGSWRDARCAGHGVLPVRRLASGIGDAVLDDFPPKHALVVRLIGGTFQVISSHHHPLAAEKAGLGAVSCWVEEMDDEAAFLELVKSRRQSEPAPLGARCTRRPSSACRHGRSVHRGVASAA
jgi:hypothetical protein